VGQVESIEPTAAYGDRYAVEAAIGTIKSQGHMDRMSSRAIRLPEKPLGEIAVFGYQFPATCGAHEFRVYETGNAQILEYSYAGGDGELHTIRDYVSGSSPFVEPGLWSDLDHTADSISTMMSLVSQRGDRMINGAYSSGLVTGLPDVEQRTLGNAYNRALNDVYACRDAQTVASTTGK
jgi:hypothetical protein